MLDKDKARLEELEAKDCLVEDNDVIDYYRLSCEKLEEENEKLKAENQELKVKADKYDSAQRIVLSTKGIDVMMKLQAENEKYQKAIEIFERVQWLNVLFNRWYENKLFQKKNTSY